MQDHSYFTGPPTTSYWGCGRHPAEDETRLSRMRGGKVLRTSSKVFFVSYLYVYIFIFKSVPFEQTLDLTVLSKFWL